MRGPDGAHPRHLLHVFSTFGIGGPQVRFAALAKRWGARYRHTLFAMDGNYACWSRLDASVAVDRIELAVDKGRALSFANLRRFRRALVELRPDVLLTSNFGTIEWSLANRLGPGIRQVHMEDGFGPDEADGRQLARRRWLRRVALRGVDLIVPSRGLERTATEAWRVTSQRVHRIPNGIDTARYGVAPDPASLGPAQPPTGVPLIGFVGALRPEKNVARLLRALAALPPETPAHLLVVGDGSERPALGDLARELGIADRIHFAGALAEPGRVLGMLDLFALTSDTEQMPLSLLEAMAAGLPAVATDVGDVRDVLAEPNRPYVVARDARALADAIAALLGNKGKRDALGRANRAKARAEFDEARMAARYAALIDG